MLDNFDLSPPGFLKFPSANRFETVGGGGFLQYKNNNLYYRMRTGRKKSQPYFSPDDQSFTDGLATS